MGKDEQGNPQLHNPAKPGNPANPAFEVILHQGFLGNFIINFHNNYKNHNLEVLAVPTSKKIDKAAAEIKEHLPSLKSNLIDGLRKLKEKTGITGITDRTERAFINLPEDQRQKIFQKMANDPNGDKAYSYNQKNGLYQMPDDELPKTSFRTDLRNFIQFLKNEDFEFPENNEPLNTNKTIKKENSNQMQQPKFNPDAINWKDAEKLGLTRELLEKTDNMKKLLNGEKTSLFQGLKGDLGGVKISLDGKFRLVENPAGQPTFVFHGVKAALDIPKNYLGYEFSDEDKQNLKEAGNLGKQVTLMDKTTNSEFKAYVGVDKDTKEIVAIRADRIKIPNMLKGVLLTDEQKKLLEQGKPTPITGMKDDKNQEFSATVQIDPAKKGFSFQKLPETTIKETVKPEHKIQVAANNDGNKADTVKQIDTVKSQQQKDPKLKIVPGKKRGGPKL
ncbi:DUF3945 domain-containing protein [Adhaeribacter aerolatus]|uniref:DUF3945 domain-containing protein n=1 Tax=Adhaeribacter aerolatus TaxID=670289 RepID=UPI001478DA8E|nr:DUF3945 domain-containing protein [Adhaeribacter aerolatus]